MSNWFETRAGTWNAVWECLADGVASADAPARFLGLASVDGAGGAALRTVRLRHANRAAAQLTVYTDSASAKVAELRANPLASLCVWDAPRNFQIRLRVKTTISTGADVAHLWPEMTADAQRAYGGTPAPGTPIKDPRDHARTPRPERLAVLTFDILEVDTVSLDEPVHRRILFKASDGFEGDWRAP